VSNLKCPILPGADGNPVLCLRDECGWWNMYQKSCCVLAMAGAVKLMQKYGPGNMPKWKPREGGDQGEF